MSKITKQQMIEYLDRMVCDYKLILEENKKMDAYTRAFMENEMVILEAILLEIGINNAH